MVPILFWYALITHHYETIFCYGIAGRDIACNAQNLKQMENIHADKNYQPAVRYIVNDVEAALSFYVDTLGFKEVLHVKDAFASLKLESFQLFINKPGAGGAGQSMPDGAKPSPGGWNRFQITVLNLEKTVDALKNKGAKFRNEIVHGIGGDQILLLDPSGNLIELFQPPKSSSE